MTTAPLRIAPRFCGPPTSGNGGYVSGRLAAHVDAEVVTVRLHHPPPLDRALEVRHPDDGVSLFDGDQLLATATPAKPGLLDFAIPKAPDFERATQAATHFSGFERHWFPSCFVCGPNRAAGDGLRIFPGTLENDAQVAAPWTPDRTLARQATGVQDAAEVAPEFIWAALDCPGAFSLEVPEDRAVLLGELTVGMSGAIHVDERCVLVAWQIEQAGRKHRTGTALYGEDGERRGVSLATWIEVPAARD